MNKLTSSIMAFFLGTSKTPKEQNEEIAKLYPHALDDVKEKEKEKKKEGKTK